MYCLKSTTGLSKIPEAVEIRTRVFTEEQGYRGEFDDIDSEAVHVVLFDGSKPVATGRTYPSEGEGCYAVGRIAVIKEYRKKGVGSMVVKELEKLARERGAKRVTLLAQLGARGFYEKLGYTANGAERLEENCPHIEMDKLF